jgi:hypothetical protein
MAFSVQECIFMMEHYLKTELFKTSERDFCAQFGYHNSLMKCVIWKFAKMLRETGNWNVVKCVVPLTVVTEDCSSQVSERLMASPHKSLQKLAQQSGMSYSS